MLFLRASRLFRILILGGSALLAACSTSGNRFDTADLRFLVPGETTLQEAAQLLQGDPVNVYRQVDGSATARWAHTATLATDAVYFNQELWLAFDSRGRFLRIVKSNNVPHANLYQDGRRVDVPVPRSYGDAGGAAAAQAASAAVPSGTQPAVAPSMPAAAGAAQPAANPLSRTAVSYPIGQ